MIKDNSDPPFIIENQNYNIIQCRYCLRYLVSIFYIAAVDDDWAVVLHSLT
jgi:hypothetical protein